MILERIAAKFLEERGWKEEDEEEMGLDDGEPKGGLPQSVKDAIGEM